MLYADPGKEIMDGALCLKCPIRINHQHSKVVELTRKRFRKDGKMVITIADVNRSGVH